MRSIPVRLTLIIVTTVLAIVALLPTIMPERLPDWWLRNASRISLGLDLQGGMYLLLEVDAPKAVESRVAAYASEVRQALQRKEAGLAVVEPRGDSLAVTFQSAAQATQAEAVLREEVPGLTQRSRQEGTGGRVSAIYGLSGEEMT